MKYLWKAFECAMGVICSADLLIVEDELKRLRPLVSVVFGERVAARLGCEYSNRKGAFRRMKSTR
jgi:hypothetical protein